MRLETLHKAFKGRCHYCSRAVLLKRSKSRALVATRDHKVPLVLGGAVGGDNIVLSCRACNELKGPWTDSEFRVLFPAGSPDSFVKMFNRRLTSNGEARKAARRQLRELRASIQKAA